MNFGKISHEASKSVNTKNVITVNKTNDDTLPENYDINENPKLKEAYDYIKAGAPIVFLTGGAGTGKSTFIKYLKKNLKAETNKTCVVLAPTGVAAINIGGQTIHSFFNFKFDPFENKEIRKATKNPVIDHTDLFIIDEISMVRSCMVDHIDYALRLWCDNNLPFGGKQMLLIGDCFQLPPITDESDKDSMQFYSQWESPFFFASKVFEPEDVDVKAIQLEKIYRQKDDIHFINMLNRIRKCDDGYDKDIQFLNNNCYIETRLNTTNIPEEALLLTTRKVRAEEFNTTKLLGLQSKGKEIKAYTAFTEGNFDPQYSPSPSSLELCVGAKIMVTKNIPKDGLINGDMGKVVSFGGSGNSQNDFVNIQVRGTIYTVKRETWTSFKYEWDNTTKSIKQKPVASFCQIPLKLGWAVTIHKSQGLTLDYVAIDAADAWDSGQVYVALSRARNLNGVLLCQRIPVSQVKVDPYIKKVYETLFDDSENKTTFDETEYKDISLSNTGFTINTEERKTSVKIHGKEFELYPRIIGTSGAIQEHVRKTMTQLLYGELIPKNEMVKLLTDKNYCYNTFGINYRGIKFTLLAVDISRNYQRYWKDMYNGFYICSQWYQNCTDKFAKWLIYLSSITNTETDASEKKPIVIKPKETSFTDMKIVKAIETHTAKRSASLVNGNNKFVKEDGTVLLTTPTGMHNKSLPWSDKKVTLHVYKKEDDIITDWSWED